MGNKKKWYFCDKHHIGLVTKPLSIKATSKKLSVYIFSLIIFTWPAGPATETL